MADKRYKILIVDDEEDNLALLYRTLRSKYGPLRSTDQGSAGFCRTLPAQSGNAPLSRLRRQLPLQGSLPMRQLPIKPPLQGEADAPHGADGGHQPCGCTSGFRPGRRAACHAHRSAAAIPASSAGTGV